MSQCRLGTEDYWARVADAKERAQLAKDPQVRTAYIKAIESWTALAEHSQRMEDEANRPAPTHRRTV